jgi:hypothetical protein
MLHSPIFIDFILIMFGESAQIMEILMMNFLRVF